MFNWIDAVHGLEREKVELSMMNRAKKFVYLEEREDNADEDGGGMLPCWRLDWGR